MAERAHPSGDGLENRLEFETLISDLSSRFINLAVADNPAIRHVILVCPAVNTIDASALESLEAINQRLKDGGITFHLSEVKGPVMDRLKRSHFLEELTGKVHLTQFDAVSSIKPDLARGALDAGRATQPALSRKESRS
jgi:SulP family sulfate permease